MSGDSLSTHGHIDGGGTTTPIPVSPTPELANNLFFKAEKWVNKVRNEVALIQVTLFRGNDNRQIVATPDMTVFKYTDKRGIMVRKEVRDFIINIEDYRVLATALIPQEGDLIEETQDTTLHRYEVLSVNNEPVYILTGAYRTAYRVHTKLIKEVAV